MMDVMNKERERERDGVCEEVAAVYRGSGRERKRKILVNMNEERYVCCDTQESVINYGLY